MPSPLSIEEGKMRILLTGFEPFGGEKVNPSWEAVKDMCGNDTRAVCLPVEWEAGPSKLTEEIEAFRPDAVVSFGQAGGRDGVSVENYAYNNCDCKAPDNAQVIREGIPVIEGAPERLEATLPVGTIVKALTDNRIHAYISESAGRYICNSVMFTALQYACEHGLNMKAGFIHLPYLPEQTKDKPSMDMETQKKAARIIVETVVKTLHEDDQVI